MTRLRPVAVLGALLIVAAGLRGCGLGMIEIDPNDQLSFRIENGAVGSALVLIRVGGQADSIDGAPVNAAAKAQGTSLSAQSITILSNEAEPTGRLLVHFRENLRGTVELPVCGIDPHDVDRPRDLAGLFQI